MTTVAPSSTPEYRAWRNMLARCDKPTHPAYPDYGGRGITVCERWRSFDHFREDMGARPSTRHTLERIDNERGYTAENCRWATWVEQLRNTSRNHMVLLKGELMPVAAAAEALGVRPGLINSRLFRGEPVQDAVERPPLRTGRARLMVVYRRKRVLLAALCRELGLDYPMVRQRIKVGWSIEDAIAEPKITDPVLRRRSQKKRDRSK